MKSFSSLGLSLAACIALLSGCGGGGLPGLNRLTTQNASQNTVQTPSRAGQVSLTVMWPLRTRLIPAASNSIQVSLNRGSTTLLTQLLTRPTTGNTSSVSFTNVAPGNYSLAAVAYPNVNGSGIAQAQGASALTVIAGQTVPVTVNMASTIASLTLTPNPLTLGAGTTYPLTPTAKDSANNIVLLTAGKLTWSSNNTNAATVDATGVVTCLGNGSATITVTDSESHKSATSAITCVQPISWYKAENNALDAEGNNNGTISGGVTYTTGAVGQGFLFNGVDGVVNLGDPADLAFTGSFTIDCWVETNALPSASQDWDNIVFRGDDRGGYDPYFLAIRSDGTLDFQIGADAVNVTYLKTPAVLGLLQHITCTLDGTSGDMRLYVDGQLAVETTTTVRPLQNLQSGIPGGVALGNSAGAGTTYHYPHNGIIDEVKLYNAVVPPTN